LRPKAIVGIVLILAGIVIIIFIAVIIIAVMGHNADDISDILGAIDPNSIAFKIVIWIPIIACFIPGYYLVKSK